jgi:hypothetical protein
MNDIHIYIKTFMNVPEIPKEVEIVEGTLRDLLQKVLGNVHFAHQIIDAKTGEIKSDCIFEISLNSVPFYSLSAGLDTELHDSDTMTFSLIPLIPCCFLLTIYDTISP